MKERKYDTFSFAKAEHRLRLGNKWIRRQDWKTNYLSLVNNKVVICSSFDSKAIWDLTDQDKLANDWVDPGA